MNKEKKQEILHGDCLELMKNIPDKSIDMVLTSPPYDNLRTYNNSLNWNFEIFKPIANELFRTTKDGGVIVWIVNDATINGSETGTSFKQALYFKEIGFNLHDTMVWHKTNGMPQIDKSRFTQSFEYMFVFSKGKPLNANPIKTLTKNAGKFLNRGGGNDESICKKSGNVVRNDRIAPNVYSSSVGGKNYGHPAIFPLQLATDHIISWSNENDLILDCFGGSGTTAIACLNTNRQFIVMEKEKKYIDIIHKRVNEHKIKLESKLF